ncbi:MAG: hypothetical protein Q7R41_01015 [Phycisphaerales bacterium]|nr:hypothetical protein [Phycisphaerales bacterium]
MLKDGGIREAEAAGAGLDGARATLCARLEGTDAVRGAFRPNDAPLAMLVRGGAVRGELTLAGADRGAPAIRGTERLADARDAGLERSSRSAPAWSGTAINIAATNAATEIQRPLLFVFMGNLRRPILHGTLLSPCPKRTRSPD